MSLSVRLTIFEASKLSIRRPEGSVVLSFTDSTVLGSGAFGQVVKGTYEGNDVAVKMLKNNANQNADYLRSMLGELKVMSYLGSHPNLVTLIGAVTANIRGGEVYLIFEYCSHGNAHKFVRKHRDAFVDFFANPAPSSAFATQNRRRYVAAAET